jgi:hypothetical protein
VIPSSKLVEAILLSVLCVWSTPGHSQGVDCGKIYPGEEFGQPTGGTHGQACYVEWAPDTQDQESDLLAHCQKHTGIRYLDFRRDEANARVICIFKPVPGAPAKTAVSASQDNWWGQGLTALVQTWTDACTAKEGAEDEATAVCWLEAAEAIAPYASNVGAPLANQINRLQGAWLRRAMNLMSAQTSEPDLVQPASLYSAASEPVSQQQVDTTTVVAPAGHESDGKQAASKAAAAKQEAAAARKPPLLRKKRSAEKPKIAALSSPILEKPSPSKRRKKLATPRTKTPTIKPQSDKRVALAGTGIREQDSGASRKKPPKATFVKTSTTSLCFLSTEWC